MAHAREQLGHHFREMLTDEQQAALDRVRTVLGQKAKQEHTNLVQHLPKLPELESQDE